MYQVSKIMGRVALAFSLVFIFAANGSAQNLSGTEIQIIPLSSTTASGGDVVEFAIQLEGNALPNPGILGFDIELTLHQDVEWEAPASLNLSNCAYPQLTQEDFQVLYLPINNWVQINAGFQAALLGPGEIGRFKLKLKSGTLDPSEFITDDGIGILVVDDIGFKTIAPATLDKEISTEFIPFPNPFQESLQFQWGDDQPESIAIYNVQGQLIDILEGHSLSTSTWRPTNLKAGIYQVIATYPNGSTAIRKVIKE